MVLKKPNTGSIGCNLGRVRMARVKLVVLPQVVEHHDVRLKKLQVQVQFLRNCWPMFLFLVTVVDLNSWLVNFCHGNISLNWLMEEMITKKPILSACVFGTGAYTQGNGRLGIGGRDLGHSEAPPLRSSREPGEQHMAQQLTTFPMRMCGFGLSSVFRCPPAGFWASWAYVLTMIEKRNRAIAEMFEHAMADDEALKQGVLSILSRAASDLDRQGFVWRPTWPDLRTGKHPQENLSKEPGEWQHSWQCWSSSVSDAHSKQELLSGQIAANRAHLWSPWRTG